MRDLFGQQLCLYVVMSFLFVIFAALILLLTNYALVFSIHRPCPPTPKEELKKLLGPAFNPRYMSFVSGNAVEHEYLPLQLGAPSLSDGSSLADQPASSATSRDDNARPLSFAVSSNYRRLLGSFSQSEQPASAQVTHDRNRVHLRTMRSTGYSGPNETVPFPAANETKSHSTAPLKQHPLEVFISRISRAISRPSSSDLRPWKCDTKDIWMDLGQDHFPRYLRSAVCSSDRCWWGRYYCRPKAFTVKVLRRLHDKCVEMTPENAQRYHFPLELLDGDDPSQRWREPWVFEEVAVNFCCECVP